MKVRAAGNTQRLKSGRNAKFCIIAADRKYAPGIAKTAEYKIS